MTYVKTEADKARNRERKREWYQTNRETQYARVKEQQQKNQQWFIEYKATLKCERCSEDHPAVLDFHHRDPSKKSSHLSGAAVRKGWSVARLKEEIAKCEVLCSNCHRKLHWSQRPVAQ